MKIINRIKGNEIEITIAGLLVLIAFTCIGLVGYNFYGHFTQRETITFEVINKEVYVRISQICTTTNNITTCIPTRVTTHCVFSDKEKFTTSLSLYNKIMIGKKHTMYVTGWSENRIIRDVLE